MITLSTANLSNRSSYVLACRYHWAFLVGPKAEHGKHPVPGRRYHVKNDPNSHWEYEEMEVPDVQNATNLLARVLIAKVKDHDRLEAIFRGVPVVQNERAWRCHTWIEDALRGIADDGGAVGTAVLDWQTIEATGREYVAGKISEGRYRSGADVATKPTWDMLENRELVA